MKSIILVGLPVLALSWALPGRADAQTQPTTVRDVLSFLITNQTVPTGDAASDRASATATADTLTRALLVSLSTLPTTSSSGGFLYQFNPALGVPERVSGSFGPIFVERSRTAGASRASLGLSYQYASFDRLDALDLTSGTLVTTANQFTGAGAPFDVETLKLRIRASTMTVWGSVGVTDRVDISAALPVVALSLDGVRVDTYYGQAVQEAEATASTVSLADMLVRTKIGIVNGPGGGVAVGADLRLPTGREDSLTGAGKAGIRGFAVTSFEHGPVSAHVQAGVTRGGASDQVDYGVALAVSPAAALTVSAELFGRRFSELGGIGQSIAPHPSLPNVETLRLVAVGTSSNTALAAFGFKWNMSASWLVSAHLALPVTAGGLRARFSPAISLEHAFGG